MRCNHEWSEDRYDVVPSQVCVRCNAFQVEEEYAELVRDAFKRGAEAMRKRCAMWIKHNSHEDGLGMGSQRIESALAALPIPEEP